MPDQLTHISTSGGLISAAFIENVRAPGSRQSGVEPESFDLPWSPAPRNPAAMEETIATAWELLLERWDAVRMDLPAMDISQVRSRWLLPLFQVLDFEPAYLRSDTVLDDAGRLRFPLSHRGWDGEGAPVLHTVLPSQGLDERMASGRGVKLKSPHDMLQAFLNASPGDRWALLSNGVLLRLLRDYHHTFTKGYVQFDLESILETRNYGDFRALYRMCHASRFVEVPGTSEVPGTLCLLEKFYADSIATGIKVGEDLREQVRQAIEILGNGFLDGDLIRRLQADSDLCYFYYGEILRVIYRILFLLFAEQRGMMPGRDSLYAEVYAISALRARAEGDIPREDDFADLWEGLKVTFRMVREGVDALGVYGYDGMLFEDDPGSPLAGRTARNSDLLRAIRSLTLIEREDVLQRISYADLGVEELGSIYESLLDYTPRLTVAAEEVNGREVPPNIFYLDPRGSERKTTGSYYTHPSLVNELIKSALLPVAWDRLKGAGLPVIAETEIGEATAGLLLDYADLTDAQRVAGEKALLAMTVCDPAAGSGHFLVKANNALGAELARVRTGDEYPTEPQVHAAKRDVLAHCIYAVDLNPMAVELCKVSLWINASVRDKPLSFLNHHCKCGNSLIGTTPELMAEGIPVDAFALGITGDDPDTAKAIRTRNRQERREIEGGQAYQMAFRVTMYEPSGTVRQEYVTVGDMAEDEPHEARERYLAYLAGDELRQRVLEADFWTAAFFWPLAEGTEWAPTYAEFVRLQTEGPEALPTQALAQIEALSCRYHFFHWHLECPDVFGDDGDRGFDVVLGNPPWERIKLEEKEFFADKDPAIAGARTAAQRRRLIRNLPQTNLPLHTAYVTALRESEATAHFLRDSGRFPLTSGGDTNTYAVFAGLARALIGTLGRAGIVLPTGIATDYTYRDFFADLVQSNRLASLYDFENRKGLFAEVAPVMKFALITLSGGALPQTEYAFYLHSTDELADTTRHFSLDAHDLALINPNTRTVPVFRSRCDADVTRRIYRAAPVLVSEATEENPWDIRFFTMFHMTNDSHLFTPREQLEAQGFEPIGNEFTQGKRAYVPLYEAKFIQQFDHRNGTFEGVSTDRMFIARAGSKTPTSEEKANPSYGIVPRYWVEVEEVENAVPDDWTSQWFIGFKDIVRPTSDARCAVFTVFPKCAVSNKLPLILPTGIPVSSTSALLANLDGFAFDYVARQKIGGTSMNFYIVKQLPVLPPDRYTPELLDFIVPRVVELTYTAWDLQPFARDVLAEVGPKTWTRWFRSDHLGSPSPLHTTPPPDWAPGPAPPPFVWDEQRRARLRAELDALYAHLYGLTREELEYILETFPIVKRKDEKRYGEYRTKRMILEQYEVLDRMLT